MAEEILGKGAGTGQPDIGLLYIKQSETRKSTELPGIVDVLGALSVTSQFKISLHLAKYDNDTAGDLISHLNRTKVISSLPQTAYYDFFCSDASLPGASFDSSQEVGSRQGVIENFPTKRIYPPFEMTFYVDNEYKIIRLFEEWMNFINPLYSYNGEAVASEKGYGNYKNRPDFFRMRYPDDYKRIISVTKFERDFYKDGTDKLQEIPTITYRMIDAYPDQLNSIPVMYEGSVITKTTVRFLYSRYVVEHNKGNRTK
jgi:hypothetical protein